MYRMLFLMCIAISAVAAEQSLKHPHEGTTSAPEFEVIDVYGESHTLSQYRGQVVLVNFWTSWCPPCIAEFPALQRLSRTIHNKHFALLAVNMAEGKGTVQRFEHLTKAGIKVLRDLDGRVAADWSVKVYPTSFIVDGKGMLRRTIVGETDWDTQEIRAYLDELIAATATD